MKDGEYIDFEIEPRFIQSSDKSLTITKTTELDSGTYTCMAQTALDSAETSATLIVQGVPNPPSLKWVTCAKDDATVNWEPMGDNRAPILTYKIQYNTSFTPDTWETATGNFRISIYLNGFSYNSIIELFINFIFSRPFFLL